MLWEIKLFLDANCACQDQKETMTTRNNKMTQYLCVHYRNGNPTNNCETCCGITSVCGMYENKQGLPFGTVRKLSRLEDYLYEEVLDHGWTIEAERIRNKISKEVSFE